MELFKTPFSEYRYEDIHDSLYDYFVTPSNFDRMISRMPTIIEGSRGSGKTTLLQAIEYNNNPHFLGVYFKANDNILTQFCGDQHSQEAWIRLFGCYFVLTLSHQLSKLIIQLYGKHHINCDEIYRVADRFFHKKVLSLEELEEIIFQQKNNIIEYINNGARGDMPFICNYADLVKALPEALISSNEEFINQTVYYLIDEFEVYSTIQQKCVLGLLKQHDKNHTFKVVTKPWGIAEHETLSGEQIQLHHDYTPLDLTKLSDNKNEHGKSYIDFATDVCNKRIQLFLKENSVAYDPIQHDIKNYFEEISYDKELLYLLKKNHYEKTIEKHKELTFNPDHVRFIESLKESPIDYCVFVLMRKRGKSIEECIEHILSHSNQYVNLVENYRTAFLYNNIQYHTKKPINGFKDAVNVSGGNIRYLLEFCHELFRKLDINHDTYLPKRVSLKLQTDAVKSISAVNINDILYSRNVSENSYLQENAGIIIREFIFTLGKIYKSIQRSDTIPVIEPNHFSIDVNGTFGPQEMRVLRECVMNGYFIAYENNKVKNYEHITFDENMYKMHPLFCSYFNISWRKKNKITIKSNDLKTMFSGNQRELSRIINLFINQYTSNGSENNSEGTQLYLFDYSVDSQGNNNNP